MRLEKERISKEKCMLRSCIVKYLEKVLDVETVNLRIHCHTWDHGRNMYDLTRITYN